MKKKVLLIFPVLIVIVFIKYLTGNYEISYKIKEYKIKEISKNDETHFIITYEDTLYDFIYLEGRKISKKRVKDVKNEEVNGYVCLTPKISGYDSYTLCSDGEEVVSKEIAESSLLYKEYSEDFKYNKLDDNEYILIWKYDGFYYLNGSEYKTINLFNSNRYSNDLMYQVDKYLIFPKYESNYEFKTFYILDMTKGKYKEISTSYSINYDSYYAGIHKNSLYLFDNKNNNLYEINYKNNSVILAGNEVKGYIKYVNNKKESASLNDYSKNKITYFNSGEKIISAENNFLVYNNFKVKYSNENVKVINSFDRNIYYIYKDNIYKYNNNTNLVAHYFELNFNDKVIVFAYSK